MSGFSGVTGGSKARPGGETEGCAVPSPWGCSYRLRKSSFRYPFCKKASHLSPSGGALVLSLPLLEDTYGHTLPGGRDWECKHTHFSGMLCPLWIHGCSHPFRHLAP